MLIPVRALSWSPTRHWDTDRVGDDWLAARMRDFEALEGRTVTSWFGVETAFTPRRDTAAPRFTHPDVACLQLLGLALTCDDGASFVVETYQGDAGWGLLVTPGRVVDPDSFTGSFRARALPELPLGVLRGRSLVVEKDLLAEVVMTLGDRELRLESGDITVDAAGTLAWSRLDTSVLAHPG